MLWMIFYVAIYAKVYFFAIDKIYGLLQMAVVFAIPVIMMYNGQRGKNQSLSTTQTHIIMEIKKKRERHYIEGF